MISLDRIVEILEEYDLYDDNLQAQFDLVESLLDSEAAVFTFLDMVENKVNEIKSPDPKLEKVFDICDEFRKEYTNGNLS